MRTGFLPCGNCKQDRAAIKFTRANPATCCDCVKQPDKTCRMCGEVKNKSEFNREKQRCKVCQELVEGVDLERLANNCWIMNRGSGNG